MRRWFVLIIMVALTATAPATTLPTVPPVTLSGAWVSVGLPDEPLDVVAHNGQLWVSGANEMIAVSDDAGEHWTVRNEHRNGEMLFALVFPAPHTIVAYGSAGVRLASVDGGQTWKRNIVVPDAGLNQVAQIGDFAVGSTAGEFGASSDGGASWGLHGLLHQAPVGPVAVIDSKHGLVLIREPAAPLDQEIAATTDGGKSWKAIGLRGYKFDSVRVDAGEYRLYGHATGTDKAPALAGSPDGVHWEVESAPAAAYFFCAAQGCLVAGGWADLTGAEPALWALPADEVQPIMLSWAAVGETFCRVSSDLRCRTGRAPWVKPAPHVAAGPTPKIRAAQCRQCPTPGYPLQAESRGRQGSVVLHAIVGKDGKMKQVLVTAAPSAALALAALATVRKWTYHPLLSNGQPMAVDTQITVDFNLGR
ncbi:MAG TPA: TonB family protein [Terriglobales bacterium]|nr:TonB family protein [Terriglobales bacterium]